MVENDGAERDPRYFRHLPYARCDRGTLPPCAFWARGVIARCGLVAPSCLAGDVIGRYDFGGVPEIGSRVAFLDQAHYSMVKTTTFNGVRLPALAVWNSDTDALRVIREFDYSDFKGRLS